MSGVKRKAEDDGGQEAKPNPASVAAVSSPVVIKEKGDPDFVKDIEINDLRNRYVLTKGPTQAKILEETGATVQTRGVWYPDKSLATARDPPLYLHVTATSQKALDEAVAQIEALMKQELGPLTLAQQREERRERRKWPEEKCFVNLEPLRNFNLRAKIIGPGGLFVKHIQSDTGVRCQIRGQGSGFIEVETGREGDDPLHIFLMGPDESQLARAKDLADDLITVVREEWGKAKAVLDQAQYGQYGYQGAGGMPGMPMGADGNAAQPGSEAYAAYWQQIQSNPEYLAYYQQMMAAYAQQGGQPGAPPGAPPGPPPQQPPAPPGYDAPPLPPHQPHANAPRTRAPPPPMSAPPPMPDEPRREGAGRFGAQPPPPGL